MTRAENIPPFDPCSAATWLARGRAPDQAEAIAKAWRDYPDLPPTSTAADRMARTRERVVAMKPVNDAIAAAAEAERQARNFSFTEDRAASVRGDEREAADRISLNLGHTLAHALEQATGYTGILHGEAVGYGLRAALQIGVALGLTPLPRADRAAALLDRLGLGVAPRSERAAELLAIAQRDKKVSGGKIRWVVPTGDGFAVRDDLPASLVESAVAAALAGRAATHAASQQG